MLANITARFLDYKILGLVKKYNSNDNKLNLSYSRYADDLAFSFNSKINIKKFIDYIIGIMLNSKLSVWRKHYKKFKSILKNIENNWLIEEMIKWNTKTDNKIRNIESFKYVLKWHLSYIKDISPHYYIKLREIDIDLEPKK